MSPVLKRKPEAPQWVRPKDVPNPHVEAMDSAAAAWVEAGGDDDPAVVAQVRRQACDLVHRELIVGRPNVRVTVDRVAAGARDLAVSGLEPAKLDRCVWRVASAKWQADGGHSDADWLQGLPVVI